MSKFKVGDKVAYVSRIIDDGTGTIQRVPSIGSGEQYRVRLDTQPASGGKYILRREEELTFVTPPPAFISGDVVRLFFANTGEEVTVVRQHDTISHRWLVEYFDGTRAYANSSDMIVQPRVTDSLGFRVSDDGTLGRCTPSTSTHKVERLDDGTLRIVEVEL